VPDPSELLALARALADGYAQRSPTDAELRRAVSTAYYALFHKVLRAAARRFSGDGQERSAAYALLYRGFDHTRMKAVCESLDVPMLKEKLRSNLGRESVSRDMRDFAQAFPSLQEARHLADYHPTVLFAVSDVVSLIDAAELAMQAFDRAPPDEQADVLALLMVGARS
jgi:uncharacterized protein (UPF0332 family)